MASSDSDRILVGKIVAYFGLQGWVKILSHTEPKDNIFTYPQWWLKSSKQKNGAWQNFKVLKSKQQGKGLVALFEGINDRNQAEVLMGLNIYIDADQMQELSDDEFYWKDLIGLKVINELGVEFGAVSEIMATGANDVLVVHGVEKDPEVLSKLKSKRAKTKKSGKKQSIDANLDIKKETLIPYIWEQVIKQVDLENKQILVAWDEDYLTD